MRLQWISKHVRPNKWKRPKKMTANTATDELKLTCIIMSYRVCAMHIIIVHNVEIMTGWLQSTIKVKMLANRAKQTQKMCMIKCRLIMCKWMSVLSKLFNLNAIFIISVWFGVLFYSPLFSFFSSTLFAGISCGRLPFAISLFPCFKIYYKLCEWHLLCSWHSQGLAVGGEA